MSAPVTAIATSTGEAITTGVLAAFFALLAWGGFYRRRRPLGWFYVVVAALALALTLTAASGHVFHGL
ncbi:MAG: hypothetical protein M0Z30_03210 [Actinomycetota bacterium]|nr:hypothetical protein [Actinomycetota bacterium]